MRTSAAIPAKGNLRAFIATGGVLAGAGNACQAAIVHTDISDLTISLGGSIYFSLTDQAADTSGTVNEQFRLYFLASQSRPSIDGVANSGSIAGYVLGPYSIASKLSGGATISNIGITFAGTRQLYDNSYGPWANNGTHGYLGLKFTSGADRFGWAEVSYNANRSLTLYAFTYDDSGAGIQAGATAVPEPATAGAIAAVFAGSVAAFEVRRRRKAAHRPAENLP